MPDLSLLPPPPLPVLLSAERGRERERTAFGTTGLSACLTLVVPFKELDQSIGGASRKEGSAAEGDFLPSGSAFALAGLPSTALLPAGFLRSSGRHMP